MPPAGRCTCVQVALALLLGGLASAAVIKDNLYGVKALSPTDAWAVGNFGSIYKTTNAGQTWETRESGTKNPLFSVDFSDPRNGWAVGKSAIILRTTDGGASWKPQKSVIPTDKHLFKVAALDANTAWAVGDWGAMTVTHDGGAHWEDRSIADDVVLYDVSFPDAQHGFVSGEFGTVLATEDGGGTWTKRPTGTEKTLFGIHFETPQRGWAVGIDGLVLHTADAGGTWTVQHGDAQAAALDELGFMEAMQNPGLYAVRVVGRYGVVVGETGTVLVSTDGGDSWGRLLLPVGEGLAWMRDVSLLPGTQGIAVGNAGFALLFDHGEVKIPGARQAPAADAP
jgi:photosystem II stability/assembly factor-like uncharacterized protein